MNSYFWSLAALAFPQTRAANLVPPRESPIHHVLLPPDEHLLCYDYLYFVCANQVRVFGLYFTLDAQMENKPNEFEFDYSPAWRFAGQHMHWNPDLQRITEQYIRQAVGSSEDQPTPSVCPLYMFAFEILTAAIVDCNPYASW